MACDSAWEIRSTDFDYGLTPTFLFRPREFRHNRAPNPRHAAGAGAPVRHDAQQRGPGLIQLVIPAQRAGLPRAGRRAQLAIPQPEVQRLHLQPWAVKLCTAAVITLLVTPSFVLLGHGVCRAVDSVAAWARSFRTPKIATIWSATSKQPVIAAGTGSAVREAPHVGNGPSEAVCESIIDLACHNPRWSAGNISGWLAQRGVRLAGKDVQAVLEREGLGTETERSANTERMFLDGTILLTPADVSMLESFNLCLRDRKRMPTAPGERIDLDVMYTDAVIGDHHTTLQIAVDAYSGYAFVAPYSSEWPSHVAELLDQVVLPQYAAWGLSVKSVMTDSRSLYRGNDSHPLEQLLATRGIRHELQKFPGMPQSGFTWRFRKALQDEFLHQKRAPRVTSMEAFRTALIAWLAEYNTTRPHNGYPNWGTPPVGRIETFIASGK